MDNHVVVDASVLVSLFLLQDVHYGAGDMWLRQYTATGGILSAPNLVLSEVGGAMMRRTKLATDAQLALSKMLALRILQLVPLDDALAYAAAQVAITMQLKGSDATYVALAQQLQIPLVTWDGEQLLRAAHLPTFTPATHPL